MFGIVEFNIYSSLKFNVMTNAVINFYLERVSKVMLDGLVFVKREYLREIKI